MLSVEDYIRLLSEGHLSDAEISELREGLQIYIGKFLDNYFKDELRDDDEL